MYMYDIQHDIMHKNHPKHLLISPNNLGPRPEKSPKIAQKTSRLGVAPPKWMNFRKDSKRGGGQFPSKNLSCSFSKNEGGGVKGRLEIFQKFIRFGSGILP